ncbi:acyl carrier protein [Amycolatopsis sp. NBC_00345]|uniref:acyl carrier protein n=1 Tax=Amycolatopsis sp. NBC_00345 TaxID=2975955 RepID=UPI002E258AE0
MDDVQLIIRKFLVDDLFVEFPEPEIGSDDRLRAEFGLDSLGFVELRVLCEQRFGIHISDEDFSTENFTSINSVADLVQKLRAAQGV